MCESVCVCVCVYVIIVHSRSIEPRKLCVGVKYYIVHVHMYSMPYYTYGVQLTFYS